MHRNMRAFLDMIAYSEIGSALLDLSDDGYNVIVGSTPAVPLLFTSYADHPRRRVTIKKGLVSSAAGRYQILTRYYDYYKESLRLPDFSPESQDAIAAQMIKECKAVEDIEAGRFSEAVKKCRSRWASLPGAGYGQHENKLDSLAKAYVLAGGVISA